MIVVRSPDLTHVLAFERADAAGSWQLPQGGLKAGEAPIEGAWRELLEETGLGEVDVVARAEFPFDALHADIEPTPDGSEFVAWQWVEPQWLVNHVVEWRRGPYERVLGTL